MDQVIKSISTQLLLLIWLLSSIHIQANDFIDRKSFFWSLQFKGPDSRRYVGLLTNNMYMGKSGITHSSWYLCRPFSERHFQRTSQMTLSTEGPEYVTAANPFWVFSKTAGNGIAQTITRYTLESQTSDCISCENCCRFRDGEDLLPVLCFAYLLCCPCAAAYTAWATIWQHRAESESRRVGNLRDSTLENILPDVSMRDVSLTQFSLMGESPRNPLPPSTNVIHLVGNDTMTQNWLRAVITEALNESHIVIPGFLHTPTRVLISASTASNNQNSGSEILLQSHGGDPEIQRIQMGVSFHTQDEHEAYYQIDRLLIEGESVELRLEISPEVVNAQPQHHYFNGRTNRSSRPQAAGAGLHEQYPLTLQLPQPLQPPSYEAAMREGGGSYPQ